MGIRMGEPGRGNARSPTNESIVHEEGTRGSETSKYPEEKKENSITLVVASEEVRGQTMGLRTTGVEGLRHLKVADPKRLECRTSESYSLVGEDKDREQVPEYRGTREILWEAGGTTPQA